MQVLELTSLYGEYVCRLSCVQTRCAQDPSPQFIRNYFSAFANDPILTSVRGVEKLEAGTPDGESDEKEKVEEMEKDAPETRHCVVVVMYSFIATESDKSQLGLLLMYISVD